MSSGKSRKERYSLHNAVKLLQSGEEYFSALENLIHSAHEEIHLQTYILAQDETGQRIANALIQASSVRGVKVYLLVDAYGSQNLSGAFIQNLKQAGIQFQKYGRFYSHGRLHIGRRLHRKVVVADGKSAIVGGINISNNYNDIQGQKAWLDFAVLLHGAVCNRLHLICRQRWMNIRFKKFSGKIRKPHLSASSSHTSEMLVRVSQNDFLRRKNDTAITYRNAIRQSMSTIIIVGGYFLPGGQVRRLLKSAVRRGVKICVLVSEKSDVSLAINARRYLYDWLLRYNIAIYEYIPSNVHGKVLVADSKFVSVGSYDLNNLSTYSNIELNIDIRDEAFALKCVHTLKRIMENECRLVTKEYFEKEITLFQRLINWFSYRFVKTFFVLSVWLANRKDKDI